MAPTGKHRETILTAAVSLFRRRGYSGTGLAEILSESGAPKGSLYHYFPGGKTEIGAAAVSLAGGQVTRTLKALAAEHDTPEALLRAYAAQLAAWMEQSQWRSGCPIATVLLETAPQEDKITEAGAEAFQDWTRVFEDAMIDSCVAPERARSLARLAIATMEGSLILSRVEKSSTPILSAAEAVAGLIASARQG